MGWLFAFLFFVRIGVLSVCLASMDSGISLLWEHLRAGFYDFVFFTAAKIRIISIKG